MAVFSPDASTSNEQLALHAAVRSPDGKASPAARAAFDSLYKRFSRRLLPFLYGRLRGDQAEDIHQQTWQLVWMNLPKFAGQNFSGWIFQIAKNCVVSLHRKGKTESLKDDVSVVDVRSTVFAGLLAFEEKRQLESCLERLSPRERHIFQGRCEGMPHAEIAGQLTISEENSQKLLSETVAKLKRCVQRGNP